MVLYSKKLVPGDNVKVMSGVHRGQHGQYMGRDSATNYAQVKLNNNTVLIVEERRLRYAGYDD